MEQGIGVSHSRAEGENVVEIVIEITNTSPLIFIFNNSIFIAHYAVIR